MVSYKKNFSSEKNFVLYRKQKSFEIFWWFFMTSYCEKLKSVVIKIMLRIYFRSTVWILILFPYLDSIRAGNSLISFLRESLVFCPIMRKWAIRSKQWATHSFSHFWWGTWALRSRSLISSEWPERNAHGRSFLVSNLRDLLTSLIFVERPDQFTHIAHQKRGNELTGAHLSWAI